MFLVINYFFLSPVGAILNIVLIYIYLKFAIPKFIFKQMRDFRNLFNYFLYFICILFLTPYAVYYFRVYLALNTCNFATLSIGCANFYILYFGELEPTRNMAIAARVYSTAYILNTLVCCIGIPVFVHALKFLKRNRELIFEIRRTMKDFHCTMICFVMLLGSVMRTFHASNAKLYSQNIWDIMTTRAFFTGPFSYFCLVISTLGLFLAFGSPKQTVTGKSEDGNREI